MLDPDRGASVDVTEVPQDATDRDPVRCPNGLEHVSRLILERSGTVMQFVGDEVFAVFGAPLPQDDAAEIGLGCSRAIIAAAPGINAELTAAGLPEISYGIGYHFGEVIAAHVGSTTRRQYAVVGDTINVGSRLCGQAKADEIVCSQEVIDAVGGDLDDAEDIGELALKGVRRAVVGYRIARTTEHAGGSPPPAQAPATS